MENEKEQKTKKFVTDEELIQDMERLFLKKYLSNSDCQTAYTVGLYYQCADYNQQDILNTAALQKKLRPLIDNIDQAKIEKIFTECNKIFLHVKTKTRENGLRHSKLRGKVEERLLETEEWNSNSDKLTIAFFMGYDSYWRVFGEKYQ
ncbi:MAG: hypothetical protein ACTSO7_14755 [Candidatus Heimdallarchaeota archaeon]